MLGESERERLQCKFDICYINGLRGCRLREVRSAARVVPESYIIVVHIYEYCYSLVGVKPVWRRSYIISCAILMNMVVHKYEWTSVAEKLQSDWAAIIVAAEQIQVHRLASQPTYPFLPEVGPRPTSVDLGFAYCVLSLLQCRGVGSNLKVIRPWARSTMGVA